MRETLDARVGDWKASPGLRLPEPAASLEQAKADLDEFGVAILAHALSEDELTAVRARTVAQAAGEREAGLATLEYDGANQRIWNLVNKGDEYIDVLHKPLVRELVGHVLEGPFILSSFTANIAGRGGEEMVLHSDQGYVPRALDHMPMVANMIFMLDDFTQENGSTRIRPGSHRSGERPNLTMRDETVALTGKAGTAALIDGRLWHGTGENLTDAKRHAIFGYFARPFLRAQENATLSVDDAVLAKASPWLMELLGFRVFGSLGGVEGPSGRGEVKVEEIEATGDALFEYLGPFMSRPTDLIGRLEGSD